LLLCLACTKIVQANSNLGIKLSALYTGITNNKSEGLHILKCYFADLETADDAQTYTEISDQASRNQNEDVQ